MPAGLVVYVFKAEFPGAGEPVKNALTLVQQAPCTLRAWCDQLQDARVVTNSGDLIIGTSLDLTFTSYTPGTLRFSTRYVENGTPVGSAVILLSSSEAAPNRGRLMSCSTQLVEGTRLWACECYIPASATIRLTAAAHNTNDPSQPLATAIDITAPGMDGHVALTMTHMFEMKCH